MVISMNHVKGFDDNTCDYDENNNSNQNSDYDDDECNDATNNTMINNNIILFNSSCEMAI